MERPTITNTKRGPEAQIQDNIIAYLRAREWYVKSTHGNMYQHGFPDLFCSHIKYGTRWIEVKNPYAYSFTPAQMREFPLMAANGVGIWILIAANQCEYEKLWQPPNWAYYLHAKNWDGVSHYKCK